MNTLEFRHQYTALYMPLCMYALRMCADTEVAQDVVQSAFTEVWSRIGEGQQFCDLRAYMYRAVHNATLTVMRSAGRMDDIPADYIDPAGADEIDTSLRDARLWRAIDSLPERRREIFLMSKRDGMTYAEIATELALSVKTVENQISKALATLRSDNTLTPSALFLLPFL